MFEGSQYFLYLSAQSGALYQGGHFSTELLGEFAGDESGMAALANLLIKRPKLPVWILVDSIDEDYRLETLPHVSGKARREMVSRRLRQIYRGQPFNSAWCQRREDSGRRDDRYLMSALNDNAWLMPWLSSIESLGLPLAGISLLSAAAQAFVSRLKVREPQMLLVSRQRAGTRYSYFEQGLLRFSRLSPDGKTSQDCADEVSRTMLYLSSQRIIARETRCTVLLLDFERDLGPAIASLNADPLFDARQITLSHATKAARASESLLRNVPGSALVCAQTLTQPTVNLAPEKLTANSRLFQQRRLIRGASIAILLVGVAASSLQWLQASHYKSEARSLYQSLVQDQQRYQEALKIYPVISIAPELLQQAVRTARQIESNEQLPKQAMGALSASLDSYPTIVLQALKWEDQLALGLNDGCHLEIQAEVKPFDGNYRQAIEHIQTFMDSLSKQQGVSNVSLLESPVSADALKPLTGSTLENRTKRQAIFRLGFDFRRAGA